MGVPMTFFVNPSNNWQFEYDKTWSAIAAAGSELGNHTWSHCYSDLSKCAAIGTQGDEIDKTTDYIVENLGVKAVYTFAAPYGDAGWNKYASGRFLLGRGVGSGWVRTSGTADWYNLPVFLVTAGMNATDFNKGVDFAREDGHWTIYLFHAILPTSANWYAGVQMKDIADSAAHARSFGDIWMDTMLNVGAYARAQQMFEQLTPQGDTWKWGLPAHFPPGRVLRVTVEGGTLLQRGAPLAWDPHGYYEVALDAGELVWRP
jgi:peptidoglycan/xylan/chitin deacetylase (PgdA/CDA1 family)